MYSLVDMIDELEARVNELNVSLEKKRFFLGWVKEGGDDFKEVLEKFSYQSYEDGYKDCEKDVAQRELDEQHILNNAGGTWC